MTNKPKKRGCNETYLYNSLKTKNKFKKSYKSTQSKRKLQ